LAQHVGRMRGRAAVNGTAPMGGSRMLPQHGA
jgi:hypothetical protein